MTDDRNNSRSIVLGKSLDKWGNFFFPPSSNHNAAAMYLDIDSQPLALSCIRRTREGAFVVAPVHNLDSDKVILANLSHEFLHSFFQVRAPARVVDEVLAYKLTGGSFGGISDGCFWLDVKGEVGRERVSALQWTCSLDEKPEVRVVNFHEMRVIYGAPKDQLFHRKGASYNTEYLAGDNMSENNVRRSLNLPPRGVYVENLGILKLPQEVTNRILKVAGIDKGSIVAYDNDVAGRYLTGLGDSALFIESSMYGESRITNLIDLVKP
jgi:hypothetical protein